MTDPTDREAREAKWRANYERLQPYYLLGTPPSPVFDREYVKEVEALEVEQADIERELGYKPAIP